MHARVRRSRPAEPRTSAPAAAATTSVPISPAAQLKPRAAEIPPAPTSGSRSLDEFRLTAPVSTVAETPSFGQGDWLPQAGASAGATSAAATPAASLPSTPVDVRTPSWQEAFASRVQWLVETQAGEARIKLNPPELGAVDVKISLVDDKTYVQLTTATAAARDELAQSLPRLRELLTVSGLEVGGASVHNGHDQHPTGDGYGTAAAESRSVAGIFRGRRRGRDLRAAPLARSDRRLRLSPTPRRFAVARAADAPIFRRFRIPALRLTYCLN